MCQARRTPQAAVPSGDAVLSVAPTSVKHMSESMMISSSDSPKQAADPDGTQLEVLEARICELAGHLAAATYQFLAHCENCR